MDRCSLGTAHHQRHHGSLYTHFLLVVAAFLSGSSIFREVVKRTSVLFSLEGAFWATEGSVIHAKPDFLAIVYAHLLAAFTYVAIHIDGEALNVSFELRL